MRKSSAPKAVVDTNIFVSGMIKAGGRPGRLLEVWRAGWFELLLTNQQQEELERVFARPKIVRNYQFLRMTLPELFEALASATRVAPSPTLPVAVRDPKDVKILAAAIGGHADYLITGDGDLLEHQGDPRLGNLQIVTAAQFLAILDERSSAAARASSPAQPSTSRLHVA